MALLENPPPESQVKTGAPQTPPMHPTAQPCCSAAVSDAASCTGAATRRAPPSCHSPAAGVIRMINRIIDFSVHNKVIVFILVAAACMMGWWSISNIPLDAIPDLSDTQVIVYSRWDRSPDIVEDQVTYPIVTALLGAPKVKAIRGFSDFGFSYVYIIFQEGTDPYWARSRTLEYLSRDHRPGFRRG